MRKFLLAAAMMTAGVFLTMDGALAATQPLAPQSFVAHQSQTQPRLTQVDYFRNHHRWHHRHWAHDHWRYYN